MTVTMKLTKAGSHLISYLREEGYRLSVTGNFEVTFKVSDCEVAGMIVEQYMNTDTVLSIGVSK